MTTLTVWADDAPETTLLRTQDAGEIRAACATLGVRFERWTVRPIADGSPSQAILDAYAEEIAAINAAEGYILVDVAALRWAPDEETQEKARAARAKFLQEHEHDDAEDRFFARGSGTFYLHLNAKVYAMTCEAGDLLSVPAHTTHWFDMGSRPDFIAIRFFHDEDGWVGAFTGSGISARFPTHDELRPTPVATA